jgi:hypothetical protein
MFDDLDFDIATFDDTDGDPEAAAIDFILANKLTDFDYRTYM